MIEEDGSLPGTRRRFLVLVAAVVLAAVGYAFPLPGIPEAGRRLTAILLAVVALWIGEAMPLSVTALLGPALAVLVGVAPAEQAFAAFGNPILILFIGSFLLARLTFKHRLSERIAFGVLSLPAVGRDPTRVFVCLGITTAVLSSWMSNVAVTAMMLPIAQAVFVAMEDTEGRAAPPFFATALMLVVTYAASVGGLFTPVGTPPNLIGIALIEQATGHRITFLDWIIEVFPVTLVTLIAMMAYLARGFRAEAGRLVYDSSRMAVRYAALGRWRPVEKRVAAALSIAAALWIAPSLLALLRPAAGAFLSSHLPEAVVPVLVTVPFFWLREERGLDRPILELEDLASINWPIIVLFGGGMCLGGLMLATGVATAIGELLALYVPGGSSPALVFVFCLLAVSVSETTSNTASANMVVPVVIAVSQRVGADPIGLGIAATAACTFGFMLPVSTPTNALAYASGYVTQRQMIRYGVLLDVIGIIALSLWFGFVAR